jgi:hypothetical protein
MKRPARLSILGKPYKVEFVPIEHIGLRDNAEDNDPGMGRTSPENQEIFIRTGQPLESEQDTVLHEVIHAVDETLGLQLNEYQVTVLATGLLAVLKDNPGLRTYLGAKRA